MPRASAATLAFVREAFADSEIARRYESLVYPQPLSRGCLLWLGAVAGRGHGRFWLGRRTGYRNVAIIAHRWAWGRAYGFDSLLSTPLLRHRCDNPLCQNPDHLEPGSAWQNASEAAIRRQVIGSPLRDIRGARGRALALRAAARAGLDLDHVERAGLPEVDRYQEPLL